MKRIILFFYLTAMLSCKEKKDMTIPENIIAKDKMTAVLLDVHILEASMGLNMIRTNDTIKSDTNLFYTVFENHQITKKQYDESMDFYMKNPKLLDEVYDSVLVKLEEKKKNK